MSFAHFSIIIIYLKENITPFFIFALIFGDFGMKKRCCLTLPPVTSEILRSVFIKIMLKIFQVGYRTLKPI